MKYLLSMDPQPGTDSQRFRDYMEPPKPVILSQKHVAGVGPDAPIVTNENGAKQSALPYRCDLLPASATLAVAKVLGYGAGKYGANNWRGIPVDDHLNHALTHIFAYLAGDTSDEHLEHAACRMLMALEKHGERT